jgi:transcription elongation factor/antiterminator RfaH
MPAGMDSIGYSCCQLNIDGWGFGTVNDIQTPVEIKLTTQEVADRFGLTTAELSDLRLSNEELQIERDGFNLYYQLQSVRGFEQRETLKVFQRVLGSERPLVMLRDMVRATGLKNIRIAGKQAVPNVGGILATGLAPPDFVSEGERKDRAARPPNRKHELAAERPRALSLDGRYSWYVVRTKPRQEIVALDHLQRQGYSCYLPNIRIKKPSGTRLVLRDEPMFPGYLFISADPVFQAKGSSPIRSTRGVYELVRFGQDPAPIQFGILNAIYERETVQLEHPEGHFKAGDRVKVVHGPLAGLESIYDAQSGEQRSMILLELLNRPLKVKVATAQLRKVG